MLAIAVSNKPQVELVKNNGHLRLTAPISSFPKGQCYKQATCLRIHHHCCNIIIRLVLSPSARAILNERRGETEMAVSKVSLVVVMIIALLYTVVLPSAHAQSTAPAPAPASDGTTIDQGIAYVLMLVALVLTYLIHPLDA